MTPVRRTTVTRSYEGSSLGGAMPIMMGGVGGYGTVNGMAGPSCVLHPDRCASIQTTTVVQPTYVTSIGGGVGGAGTAMVGGTPGVPLDPAADTADLEARIARLEETVPKAAGIAKLSLRRSCAVILKDPTIIQDEKERAEVVSACTRIVNPKADAKSEEK